MALVLGFLTWPLNFFLEGEFNMSVWAFGFDALAAAAVMVYDFTRYDAMQARTQGLVWVISQCDATLSLSLSFSLSDLGVLEASLKWR